MSNIDDMSARDLWILIAHAVTKDTLNINEARLQLSIALAMIQNINIAKEDMSVAKQVQHHLKAALADWRNNMRVHVRITGLDNKHVSTAYFRLPTEFDAELIKEDIESITVRFGPAAYCFKQNEVSYMVEEL